MNPIPTNLAYAGKNSEFREWLKAVTSLFGHLPMYCWTPDWERYLKSLGKE